MGQDIFIGVEKFSKYSEFQKGWQFSYWFIEYKSIKS